MPAAQKFLPYKGLDTDSDPGNISEQHSPFIKNMTWGENSTQQEGATRGKFTPYHGTEIYQNIQLPLGINQKCGDHHSEQLGQTFLFYWNSINQFTIWRIDGRTATVELVLKDQNLKFRREPEFYISEGRCTTQTVCRYNKVTEKEEEITYLIWTDNDIDVHFLCVEDCISTNGFTGPYFDTDPDAVREEWFKLGIPTPMDCIGITPIKRDLTDPAEVNKDNTMNFKGFQWRIKMIDVWGRESEHGFISDKYFTLVGNACIADSIGLPRCVDLTFKAGSPFINKIMIEYRTCNGNSRGFSVDDDWALYDVIEKYNNCLQQNWWERSISNPWQDEYNKQVLLGETTTNAAKIADKKGLLKYDSNTNTFRYRFCNSKECTPIPFMETNRTQPMIPLTSSSVFSIGKVIGLARNKRGFRPIDCNELDKIDFTVTPPPPTPDSCKPRKQKITIYGILYCYSDDKVVSLRRDGSNIIFASARCPQNNAYPYEQVLPPDQEGIIGYLAGTKNYCVSKQYNYQGGNFTFVGPGEPRYPVQKWEFEVLPGRYVFRIASHKSKPTDDFQKTSTYFVGQTTLNRPGRITNRTTELIIDVCDQDIEIKDNPVMIYDLTREGKGCAVVDASSVVCGYLYEDEIDKRPIEKARVIPNTTNSASSVFTDHNGFYWAYTYQNHLQVILRGKKNCVDNVTLGISQPPTNDSPFSSHFRFNELFVYRGTDKYLEKDRIYITGSVKLCNSPEIGVSGVLVVLTNGAWATTDASGKFTIIAHDMGNGSQRTEQILYSQRGPCQIKTCSDSSCNFCFPIRNVAFPNCSGTKREVTIADLTVKINGINQKGPQMGGRYALGIEGVDWMGRHHFIQQREKHYIDIPSLQETQTFGYSSIGFNINPTFRLPGFKKLIFYITENLNWDDFMTITADRIQFIDNSGKTNTAAPQQIRIYYEGLNEYNKQNDFSTNSVWQFLTDKQAPVTGDQIEFLANGDGKIFDKRIVELVKYNKEGKYISIEYRNELKDIKEGCLIKLIRPKQCETKQFYYSLNCPIKLDKDGVPQTLSGTFNYFDSYLLNRQIPVPVEVKVITTDPNTSQEITTSTTENKLTDYPFLFEHHSPSDFWGDHCWNKGWVDVKNPYENEQCNVSEIAVSKALSNNGILNQLNYFTDDDIVKLNEQEWGGITVVLPELNYLMVLCEKDNCVVVYDDNTVKMNKDGSLIAPSLENKIGKPQRKIGNNFGCDLKDINTIRKRMGRVLFLDRNKSAVVVHNYGEAINIVQGFTSEYINRKVKIVSASTNKYFHAGLDPRTNKYFLSTFDIKQAYSPTDYVNGKDHIDYESNETFVIDIDSQYFHFVDFTPEGYAYLASEKFEQQMFSFVGGKIYKHHRTNVPFINFYGIQCKPYVWSVCNIENTKGKRFQWVEVYCQEVKFHAYKILTQSGQESRILTEWWDKRENFYAAPFLCDINTRFDPNLPQQTGPNAILDGDILYGIWLSAGYTVENYTGQFFRLTGIIIFIFASEKSSTGG